MATLKLFKAQGNKALYRLSGSTRSVRFDTRSFVGGVAPEEIEVTGVDFAPVGSAPKAELPAEIREAAEKLAAFRKEQAAKRLAAMTPEQKARYEAKQKAREEQKAAKKAAKAAAKAPAAPAAAPKPAAPAAPAAKRK